MFVFPCPWCGFCLALNSEKQYELGCPKCGQKSKPLEIPDDQDLREDYPFVKWAPVDDGRSSWEHVELLKHGIRSTRYFHIDDPILAGWWRARRKKLRPCRCDTISVYKADAAKLGLTEPIFAPPPPFDPWSATNDCELLAWQVKSWSGWLDEDYSSHPVNPELKARLLQQRLHFEENTRKKEK